MIPPYMIPPYVYIPPYSYMIPPYIFLPFSAAN
jgi:hypothetical protein